VGVLQEPVPTSTARLLRHAVLDLARGEHRHRFPALLHVGTPGGLEVALADDPSWDHGLRSDVLAALLQGLRQTKPLVWVTRPGPVTVQDVDAAWLAATLAAAGERGEDATFVVVTRHAWSDPRSRVGREWKRIRQR
jgi:hypothetical protein